MLYTIPLSATPAQKTAVTINEQDITVSLHTMLRRLYADVQLNNQHIIRNRICLNNTPLINEAWRGLNGELYFIDTQGQNNPQWQGLGSRFILVYQDGY